MTELVEDGVVVRRAEQADLQGARELLVRCGLGDAGLDTTTCFVAETPTGLVGTVALEHHGEGSGRVFLLRSAAVDPSARDSRVGARLVTAALEHVDETRAPVALLTETASGFFPRFGFVEVVRADLPSALAGSAQLQGACPASAVAMLRPPAVTSPST